MIILAIGAGFLIKGALIGLGTAVLGGIGKAALTGAVAEAISRNIDVDIAGIPGFDQPFVLMSGQALNMITTIIDYTFNFITICAFLCIVFNAFKLMFGMIETKKVFVDIVTKILIVMICMFAYPTFITKTYNLSVEIGIKAAGGEKQLAGTFANLALSIKNLWEEGSREFVKIMTDGGERENGDPNGRIIVSEELIKTFANAGNMSQEDIESYLSRNNMVKGETNAKGFWIWSNKQKETEKAAKKALKNKTNTKYMKQSLAILQSLTTILTGETTLSGTSDGDKNDTISAEDLLKTGEEALEKIFFNPYIKEADIPLISTSTMVKTAIIIAEIAGSGAAAGYTNVLDTDETISIAQMAESKSPGIFTKWLGNIGIQLVYKLLLVISVIFIMIEYIITVLEFFIVAGLSALLIPFYFIDATKQFATNILKTIFTYAIKLITTITMVFFTLGMYINLGNFMLQRTELTALSTIFIYVFYCVIGMSLVKGTGGLAASVISGNPSMGLRDVTAGLHSMAHGARVINGAANAAWNTGKNAVQAGGRSFANSMNTLDGMRSAREAAIKEGAELNTKRISGAESGTPLSNRQIWNAGKAAERAFLRKSMGQNAKDSLYSAFTGQKPERDNANNVVFGKLGQTYVDKNGVQKTMSMGDAKDKNKQAGESIGKDVFEKKYGKPIKESDMSTKNLPDNNQDSCLNK